MAYREADWAAVGFAAVKYGTINQTAFVFNGNHVVFSRFFTFAFFGDFVLQTGSAGFHAFFSRVFFQERFAFFQVYFGIFSTFGSRFFLLLLQEFHHHFLSLGFSHFDFFAFKHGFHGFGEDFQIDFCALVFHLFQ